MQSDEELISELRRGIESSMEVLIQRHYKLVFSYIYRYTGDYHTAYDLTQEAFIKLVRNLDSLDRQGSFKSWLLKIARNVCRDYSRSRQYRDRSTSAEWIESYSNHPIDMLERKMDSVWIKEALRELPPYQREAIILRFYQDQKIRHIAALTSVGEATVKSRIKKGLTKLKSIMDRGMEHEEETKER